MAQRATDRLRDDVARRVMGWTTARIPWAYDQSTVCWHNPDDVPVVPRAAWRPDADERQCARVLERMLELGFDFSLAIEGGEARARFGRGGAYGSGAAHRDRRTALLLAALDALDASGDPGAR